MELSPPQSHRCLGALAVTVAAIALLGPAQSAEGQAVQPLPEAGWHGRAIQHPERDAPVRVQAALKHARPGSVRDVQRMLLRKGYRPGPVDGIYGVRTRSAVQWFQIKHSLRPTGDMNPPTLSLLRSRGTAQRTEPHAGAQPPASPRHDTPPAAAAAPEPGAVHAAQGHGAGFVLVAVLLLLAATAAGLVVIATRLRRQAAPAQPSGAEPVARQRSPQAERPRAIGYAPGRNAEAVERHAAALQRACDARGWTLARIVRDPGATRRGRALALALDRATAESAPLLVVDRLEHLGRSVRELATLLTWGARHDVALVALDSGLDTTTPEGKAAARRLLEEVAAHGSRRRHGQRPRPARTRLSSMAGRG